MDDLKALIKDGKRVRFDFYRKGELHYVHEDGFRFVVPTSDCGDGVFLHDDRAITFMRYLRKQLDANEEGRAAS